MAETSPRPEQKLELLHTVKIAETAEEQQSGAGQYIAPRLMPEKYPGEKPDTTGFLVNAEDSTVSAIRWNSDSSLWVNRGQFDPVVDARDPATEEVVAKRLDEYLTNMGLSPLDQRYVLTAFGSNRCPGQLVHKFRKWAEDHPSDDPQFAREMSFVPAINGILKGYDVVYNSTLGNIGFAFGDLYSGPETAETEIEVVVLFLTKDQMEAIHDSEIEYEFAQIGEVQLGGLVYDDRVGFGDSIQIPSYAHIGKAEVYAQTDEEGNKKPVAVGEVYGRQRRLGMMTQTEFQDFHFGNDPTGKKTKALRLAKVLNDRGIKDKAVIDGLDLDVLPEALAQAVSDEQLEANGANYRSLIRMGGKVNLATRRGFKKWAKEGTTENEKMVIDPAHMSKARVISKDPADMPTWERVRTFAKQ